MKIVQKRLKSLISIKLLFASYNIYSRKKKLYKNIQSDEDTETRRMYIVCIYIVLVVSVRNIELSLIEIKNIFIMRKQNQDRGGGGL